MKKAGIVLMVSGVALLAVWLLVNFMFRSGSTIMSPQTGVIIVKFAQAGGLLCLVVGVLLLRINKAKEVKTEQQAAAALEATREVYRLNSFGRGFLWVAGIITLPVFGFGMFPITVARKLRIVFEDDAIAIWRFGFSRIPLASVTKLTWSPGSTNAKSHLIISYTNKKGKERVFPLRLQQFENPASLRQAVVDATGKTLVMPNGTTFAPSMVPSAA